MADDAFPYEPPESRINPPSGVASHSPIKPPGGGPTNARIVVPGGMPQPESRIDPPSGVPRAEPGYFELFLDWLRWQARMGSPVG
ncbi:MAG: hypothetical protein ACXW5U_26035 [Thermoanaerobaculia bacterium]